MSKADPDPQMKIFARKDFSTICLFSDLNRDRFQMFGGLLEMHVGSVR